MIWMIFFSSAIGIGGFIRVPVAMASSAAPAFTYKQEGDALTLSGPGFVQTITGIDHAKLDRIRISPDGALAVIPYGRNDDGDCLALVALETVRKADEKPVLKPTAVVDWRPCDSTVELLDFVPTRNGWSVTLLTGHNRDVRSMFVMAARHSASLAVVREDIRT
jgi:hypothetical protein